MTTSFSDELYHYGIKGMKWGVRRYQNEDGSLTAAGRARYQDEIRSEKQKVSEAKTRYKQATREYNKATLGGMIYNENATKKLERSKKGVEVAKRGLSNVKTRAKIDLSGHKFSKRELSLVDDYKKKGMTQEEAEVAAYKRARTEKMLVGVAAMTVTAAAAYGGYKVYDRYVDRFIKSGATIQSVSTREARGVKDAFYASLNRTDNKRYVGLYGNTLATGSNGKVYKMTGKASSTMRVASEQSGKKTFDGLLKSREIDPFQLREQLSAYDGFMWTPKQQKVLERAAKALDEGRDTDQNVYRAFNIMLADHSPAQQKMTDSFYSALKKSGYDGVADLNDKLLSGYGSINPVILFGGGDKIGELRNTPISSDELKRLGSSEKVKMALRAASPTLATYGTIGAGVSGAVSASRNAQNDRIVRQYKKEHPNTTLSYQEILEAMTK